MGWHCRARSTERVARWGIGLSWGSGIVFGGVALCYETISYLKSKQLQSVTVQIFYNEHRLHFNVCAILVCV